MDHTGTLLGTSFRYRMFTGVKYLVYLLLCFNVYLFLQEELLALEHTFIDGLEPGQWIQVFSATIDTAAWVILLILFELETWVLDDRYLRGWLKWALHGIRGLCYVFIVYAFSGYCAELNTLYQVSALGSVDSCSLLGLDYSLLLDLDEYAPLDVANCSTATADLYRLTDFAIIADHATLQRARWLAWTDVINAGAWILVCLVLEIEVRLQLRDALGTRRLHFAAIVKYVLYGTLFGAAAYWGYAGVFLDFWDAALWLFAFIFIELNVFEWQQEKTSASAAAA